MRVGIFGATSAIAMECGRIWAAAGHEIALCGRSPEKLEAVKKDLETYGAKRVACHVVDLARNELHDNLISQVEGAGELELALVAHGTLSDQERCQNDINETLSELNNNFLSAVSLLTILANRFERRKKGTIAVISSVAGDRGRQSNYVYGAAKGGLSLFLQGLRNRLYKSGVHVLTVKPGFVDTPMTVELKKGALWAKPAKVAHDICRAVERRTNVLYTPWFWCFIMLIIKHIPEALFKRLKL